MKLSSRPVSITASISVIGAHCSYLIMPLCLAVVPTVPLATWDGSGLCDSCCRIQALNIWHCLDLVISFMMFSKLTLNCQTFFKTDTYLTFISVWLTCVTALFLHSCSARVLSRAPISSVIGFQLVCFEQFQNTFSSYGVALIAIKLGRNPSWSKLSLETVALSSAEHFSVFPLIVVLLWHQILPSSTLSRQQFSAKKDPMNPQWATSNRNTWHT